AGEQGLPGIGLDFSGGDQRRITGGKGFRHGGYAAPKARGKSLSAMQFPETGHAGPAAPVVILLQCTIYSAGGDSKRIANEETRTRRARSVEETDHARAFARRRR